jgi:uncharacterized delta-60 repeat protein
MRTPLAVLALLTTLGFSFSSHAESSRCAPTSAQAGRLDVPFGGGQKGVARLSFGADDEGAFQGLDVVGDDIIAVGWGVGGLGGSSFRVARLDAAGLPRHSFGGRGMVTTHWAPSTGDYERAVAIGHQRDGGLVAMGWRDVFRGETANIALARYAPDGSLDAAHFEGSGKTLIDLGGQEEVTSGLVLPDDSILVVGRRDDRLLVARATPRGTLDTTFAAPYGFFMAGLHRGSIAEAVARDADGRILVAGSVKDAANRDTLVLRLDQSGALDASFGEGGMVIAGQAMLDERAVAIAVMADGRIVVAGDAGRGESREIVVRRFLPSGAPDPEFGAHGLASSRVTTGKDEAAAMVVLPEGDIVVAGNTTDGDKNRPFLIRYKCDGALDLAFGQGGVLALDLGEYGEVHALRLYGRDQLLIAGGDVGMSPGPGTFGVVARMWM